MLGDLTRAPGEQFGHDLPCHDKGYNTPKSRAKAIALFDPVTIFLFSMRRRVKYAWLTKLLLLRYCSCDEFRE